ncbi:hypothetical protein [Paraburkholderia sp. BL23I1N1]|uniref:hypothetical protein n=1 Tax=Paraburkholderia sp. BL23I1N1 TaxID=1938802 RepID=UPI001601EC56|nr:hypothetical protein [Paraburkholderia sp. BL23I1N1]
MFVKAAARSGAIGGAGYMIINALHVAPAIMQWDSAPGFGNLKITRTFMRVKPILFRYVVKAPLVVGHRSEFTFACHERRAKTWGAFEA